MKAMREEGRSPAPAPSFEDALAHADSLHNLARYLARNPADAEDLVQETYVHALRAWGELPPGSNVKAWLFRILRNAFVSRCRRDVRSPPPDPYDTTEPAGASAAGADTLRGDAELARLRGVVSSELEAAVLRLGPDARTAILLDLEGFSEAEVAEIAGCAVGTVKSRLSRARAALRAALADYRPERSS
jgi:RNA polymerase sigma-70 factor (ECF subfamily)